MVIQAYRETISNLQGSKLVMRPQIITVETYMPATALWVEQVRVRMVCHNQIHLEEMANHLLNEWLTNNPGMGGRWSINPWTNA